MFCGFSFNGLQELFINETLVSSQSTGTVCDIGWLISQQNMRRKQ